VKHSGFLDERLHGVCEKFSCKVDCIANLTSALALYIDELSRVIFKKENMRNKSWWLSTFYSLCIQSIVRKCLIELVDIETPTNGALGAKQYLHLAVRLFIASSGNHDPLMWSYSIGPNILSSEAIPSMRDYELAQHGTRKETWYSLGIESSADYLKHLFEDDGKIFDSGVSTEDRTLGGPNVDHTKSLRLEDTHQELEEEQEAQVVSST
jgi:hypothetical protein